MDIDYSSFLGAGALLGILIPLLVWIVGLVIFYAIVRGAVRAGMRDHYNWVEKQHNAARAGYVPITGAPTDT